MPFALIAEPVSPLAWADSASLGLLLWAWAVRTCMVRLEP